MADPASTGNKKSPFAARQPASGAIYAVQGIYNAGFI